ncbi:MAG: DUF4405 domain-containing protein [Nannocystales bacterium]
MSRSGVTTATKIWTDVALFILFVVLSAPQATGLPLHEWLSLVFLPVFALHLALNWDWVLRVLGRFTRKLGAKARLNAVWDAILYPWMVFVLVSGFMASVSLFPIALGGWTPDPFWTTLHHRSSNLLLPAIGVHLALHAKWIAGVVRRRREA